MLLLLKVYATKNSKGISLKTQILFLTVFVCRYLDLVSNWRNPYNVVMKILFIVLSSVTVYWIGFRYNKGYDRENDSFRLVFILAPAALLALVTPKPDMYSVIDTLWTASIYLEAVAILPQLFLIRRTGEVCVFFFFFLPVLNTVCSRLRTLQGTTSRPWVSTERFTSSIGSIATLLRRATTAFLATLSSGAEESYRQVLLLLFLCLCV